MSWNLGSRMHSTVRHALGIVYAYAFNQRRGVSNTRIDYLLVVRSRSRVNTPKATPIGGVWWILPIQDNEEGGMGNRGNVSAITTRHGSKCCHRELSSFLWVDLTRDASVLLEAIRDRFPGCQISNQGELWRAIKRWDPVIVCFEYDCPEAAEVQVLRETRYRHPGLPILMLTAYHSEELAVWAFRAGVRDYLVKPIAREVLSETVQTLLACSRSGRVTLATPPSEDGSPPPLHGTGFSQRHRLAHRTAAASGYIAKNYAAKITVAAAAEQCHLSCSQFSRTFRKEQGACFQQYLVRYRINQACKILASFEVLVKEVAFSVGFTDPCYFARTFRQHVGMLPSAFKARHRSQDCLALLAWGGIADTQANRDLNIVRSWDPGATARTQTKKKQTDRPPLGSDPPSPNRPAPGDPGHSRIILSFSRIVLTPSTGDALV